MGLKLVVLLHKLVQLALLGLQRIPRRSGTYLSLPVHGAYAHDGRFEPQQLFTGPIGSAFSGNLTIIFR